MTLEQRTQFQSDFFNKYGVTLSIEVQSYPYLGKSDSKHLLFAERAEQIVLLKIGEYNPRFRTIKASDYQKQKIWEATLEQAFYMLMTGDTTLISGFDPTTGNLVSLDEIKKRGFSEVALKILQQSGLLYGGLDSSARSWGLL